MFEALQGCTECDALVVPDVNDWMGRERVQAVVEHLRPQQGPAAARAMLRSAGPEMGRALAAALQQGCLGGSAARHVGHAEGEALLAEAVKKSCWGTIALCFTASSAETAFKALEEAGCAERVYAGVGVAHQAARRENALVLAPHMERLPLQSYDTVFLFDGSLAADCPEWAAARLNKGAECIIIDEEYAEEIPDFANRDRLLRVYRAMRQRLAEKSSPRGQGDWRWLEELDGVSRWQAELAARILWNLP